MLFFQSLNLTRHTSVSRVIKYAKMRSFFDNTLTTLIIKNKPQKNITPCMVVLFIFNIELIMILDMFWHNVIFKGYEKTKFGFYAIFIISILTLFMKFVNKNTLMCINSCQM